MCGLVSAACSYVILRAWPVCIRSSRTLDVHVVITVLVACVGKNACVMFLSWITVYLARFVVLGFLGMIPKFSISEECVPRALWWSLWG